MPERNPPSPPVQDVLKGVLLEALLHDTTLAVAASDADGRVTVMSPGLQKLIEAEYAPVPVSEIPTHFRVYTEDGSRLLRPEEEPLNRALSGESFTDAVFCVELQGGRVLHLRATGAPLIGDDGELQGGFILFDDITAERAFVEQQRVLRDRLVETVNHELRTPLTAMLGHAELLQDLAPQLPEWATRSLRSVLEAGERLNDLVRTVSALVDLEEVGHVVPVEQDLLAVVRDAVAVGSRAWPEADVVVTGPDELVAAVDARLLARAVGALVVNALQHSPADQQVVVSVRATGPAAEVTVADHGPGIPPEERARLLQPFERGVSDLTAPSGRGLGLALARGVAQAHGGMLWLTGNAPHGLRVTIRVPRSTSAAGTGRPFPGHDTRA